MTAAEGNARTRVVVGLGNPGPRYDDTRHNVGWWMADRLVHDWGLGGFERTGPADLSRGVVRDVPVVVLKPLTYMNRSGAALLPWMREEGFIAAEHLLVLVDDASLDAGQVRFRPRGSAGGHNGLKSIEAALGSREYARLRIGVGRVPSGGDLVDWVLSPMGPDDEDAVLARLPELVGGVELWMAEGIEAAMNRHNG